MNTCHYNSLLGFCKGIDSDEYIKRGDKMTVAAAGPCMMETELTGHDSSSMQIASNSYMLAADFMDEYADVFEELAK